MALAERPGVVDTPFHDDDDTRILQQPPAWYQRGWLVSLLALVLIVAVSPVAAVWFYQQEHAGRIYQGVSALGIDLSGRTPAEAEQLIAGRAAEITARPVLIRAGDNQWRTDWRRLGLEMPVRPIVEQAMSVGRQGSLPDQLYAQLRALRSGRAVGAQEVLDESAIRAFVEQAGAQIDRPVRNARLDLLPDLTLELTTAQAGRRLEQDESVRLLRAAVDGPTETVDLPVSILQPVTTDELRLPAKAKAEKILAGPLALSYAEKSWTIERAELGELLVFSGGPGVPIDVKLDVEKLRPRIEKIAAEVRQEPRDATLEWANGAVRAKTPSQDGRTLDVEAALRQTVARAEAGERSVTLPVEVAKPRIDSSRLADLGIKELIDSATTSFAGSVPQKQHNIRLAASRLNGTVIPPGERFSFNTALGPTTLDNGYQIAFGIMSTGGQNHKTVPSVAGGICQVATTLFQPMFWSGYQLEERHWHLYWIPAYASKGVVGLDATVDEEVGLDLQFINNSGTYLLIQSKTDESSVTFELYGTKPAWDVKVDGPTIGNRQPPDPTPVVEREPLLPDGQRIQVESAREGFTASFVRTVTNRDGTVRTLNLESRYTPSRNVTLVGTGGQEAPARPAGAGGSSGEGA